MKKFFFNVADCPFSIEAPDRETITTLLPSYESFEVGEQAAEDLVFSVSLTDGAVSLDAEGTELGHFENCGTTHGVYLLDDNGYKITVTSPFGNRCAAMKATHDFSRCVISTFGEETAKSYGIGNEMMLAFAFATAAKKVLLMHASVIVNNNRGYLFLGTSGTGKSTHSRLWLKHIRGSELLNDDNPAVRIAENGELTVYGTPWSGSTPCYRNLSAGVGGFLALEQAPANEIKRLSKLLAFAAIYNSCSMMRWDKEIHSLILKTSEAISQITPIFSLRCLPDEAAARLSYQTLTSPLL